MTQYFHVDESGDPGLHSLKGTPYFILAMVQLPNREPIAEFAELRKAFHAFPAFEFRYHQMNAEQKERFFQAIQNVPFRVRAAVLFKADMPVRLKGFSGIKVTIDLLTRLTLRASPLDIGNDILVLDSASAPMRKALRIHLSRECKRLKRERPFKKIVSDVSSHDDGLQLADMIAGALRLYAWDKIPVYYQTFSSQVVDLWYVK
jgi:hypothetical protein